MASRLANFRLFPHSEAKIQLIIEKLALSSATEAVKLAVELLYVQAVEEPDKPFTEGPYLKRIRAGDRSDKVSSHHVADKQTSVRRADRKEPLSKRLRLRTRKPAKPRTRKR